MMSARASPNARRTASISPQSPSRSHLNRPRASAKRKPLACPSQPTCGRAAEMTRNVIVRTEYWPKPIPLRSGDWSATLDSYEPGDPVGYGETEAEAVFDLYNQLFEREEEDEERSTPDDMAIKP